MMGKILSFSTWLLLLLLAALPPVSSGHPNVGSLRRRRELQTNLEEITSLDENNEYLGIPGTTQTINGYDTALGDDAICWRGAATEQANATGDVVDQLVQTVFPNPLVENFTWQGQIEILKRCPKGNSVTIEKSEESLRGERLRTLRYYNYTLRVKLDLDTLDGDYIVTDDKNSSIALQVVVCSLGKSGFCSPFVHEQANAREAIDKLNNGEELTTTEKKVTGDMHGGTHIHSPWVFLDLGNNRTVDQNITIPMIVNYPGDYFVLGTVQLYTGMNGSNGYRWDIANALPAEDGRYILYQDPPQLNQVSDRILHFSYAAISISGAVILFLFGHTLFHRQHQVLKLSQGDFLLVFLFNALLSTIFSFLLMPKNNVYCRIAYPMILIPIQLMYAITVGRMWRIHAVISPLLLEHLTKGNPGPIQRFVEGITYISFKLYNMFVMKKENRRRSSAGARQQISQFQLALVVALFTCPQVILQAVAFFIQPQELVIEFNEDESIGRYACGNGVPNSQNILLYGFLLLFILVIILLVMAHSSRKLPSLFNETHVICDSTFLSLVLLLLGGTVIALTDNPETSPDVEYIVAQVLILSITLNPAVRIMWPKLGMVWRNESVVVSKLVTDHHRKARERESTRSGGIANGVHVSGVQMDLSTSAYQYLDRSSNYDPSQTNRLLTMQSRSNEIERSSVASFADPTETVADNSSSPPEHDLSLSKEDLTDREEEQRNGVLAKSLDLTSSTELDMESGGSASPSSPSGAENKEPENDDTNDADNDNQPPAEGAEFIAETNDDALNSSKTRYSLESGSSGFLRNAMIKGLSWTGLSSKRVVSELGEEKQVNTDREEGDVATKKSEKSSRQHGKQSRKPIVVTQDETPARSLVLKMIDLQDRLEAVNNKIMSGLAVTQEDWSVITKLTSKLDRTFNEEVEFEWDVERRCQQTLQEVMPDDMSGGLSISGSVKNSKSGAKEGTDSKESVRSRVSPKKTSSEKKHAIASAASLKSLRLKNIKGKAFSDMKEEELSRSNHSFRNGAKRVAVGSKPKHAAAAVPSIPQEVASREFREVVSASKKKSIPQEIPSREFREIVPASKNKSTPRPRLSDPDLGPSAESAISTFKDEGHDDMFFL